MSDFKKTSFCSTFYKKLKSFFINILSGKATAKEDF